jgi:NAD(P)-dependent dehydrogenase (short-subunit alcohol dehydrogenase family)
LGKATVKELRKACKTKDISFRYTDCGDEKSVKNLMDYTYNKFGGINILVNNASLFTHGHIFGEGGSGTSNDYLPTAK